MIILFIALPGSSSIFKFLLLIHQISDHFNPISYKINQISYQINQISYRLSLRELSKIIFLNFNPPTFIISIPIL